MTRSILRNKHLKNKTEENEQMNKCVSFLRKIKIKSLWNF